jgi:ATP-dependent DNA ligase
LKGKLSLVSRNRESFNRQYPTIVEALSDLPESTVVDGEVAAVDDAGRPNFNNTKVHNKRLTKPQCSLFVVFGHGAFVLIAPCIDKNR